MVGSRSRYDTVRVEFTPGVKWPGQRTSSGTRIDGS
jgi:hypothetical protein